MLSRIFKQFPGHSCINSTSQVLPRMIVTWKDIDRGGEADYFHKVDRDNCHLLAKRIQNIMKQPDTSSEKREIQKIVDTCYHTSQFRNKPASLTIGEQVKIIMAENSDYPFQKKQLIKLFVQLIDTPPKGYQRIRE